jgi:hypothetical protein
MSGRSREKLVIRPGFSWPLALMLLLSHVMAISLLPLLPLDLTIQLLLAGAVVASLLYYGARDLLGWGRQAVAIIEWSEPTGWTLIDRWGNSYPATLHGSSYLHRYLVILNFGLCDGTGRRLILTEQAVGSDLFRQLRARLQWMPKG